MEKAGSADRNAILPDSTRVEMVKERLATRASRKKYAMKGEHAAGAHQKLSRSRRATSQKGENALATLKWLGKTCKFWTPGNWEAELKVLWQAISRRVSRQLGSSSLCL